MPSPTDRRDARPSASVSSARSRPASSAAGARSPPSDLAGLRHRPGVSASARTKSRPRPRPTSRRCWHDRRRGDGRSGRASPARAPTRAAGRSATTGSGSGRTPDGPIGARAFGSRPVCSSRATGGRGITMPDDPGATRQAPPPLLRRAFDVEAAPRRARLYATAHGVFRMAINGRPVSEDILAPGWTAYRDRLLVETYDVTASASHRSQRHHGRGGRRLVSRSPRLGSRRMTAPVRPGRGPVRTTRSRSRRREPRRHDGRTWRASSGEIRSADLYDGATSICERARTAGNARLRRRVLGSRWWRAVRRPVLEPRIAPPVRVAGSTGHPAGRGPAGPFRTDGGQNITGHVRMTRAGHARPRHGAPRRGPRAGRIPAYPLPALGKGDRYLRARR